MCNKALILHWKWNVILWLGSMWCAQINTGGICPRVFCSWMRVQMVHPEAKNSRTISSIVYWTTIIAHLNMLYQGKSKSSTDIMRAGEDSTELQLLWDWHMHGKLCQQRNVQGLIKKKKNVLLQGYLWSCLCILIEIDCTRLPCSITIFRFWIVHCLYLSDSEAIIHFRNILETYFFFTQKLKHLLFKIFSIWEGEGL